MFLFIFSYLFVCVHLRTSIANYLQFVVLGKNISSLFIVILLSKMSVLLVNSTCAVFWSGANYRQHCAKCKAPVFNLLRGQFWGFSPTRCSDGGEIWHGVLWSPPPCQISPPSVQRLGYRTPKLKFLLRFHQNVEYKCPAGAYSLRDFIKLAEFVPRFMMPCP